jgi:ribosomal protein S8
MLTDPIADMLTRIRNANKALQERTEMPTSRQKEEIARILQEEGYIVGYSVRNGESFDSLVIELKYGPSRAAASTLARIACRASSAGWARRSCPRPGVWSRARPPSAKASAAKSSVLCGNSE